MERDDCSRGRVRGGERRQRINYKRLHINANLTTEAVQATNETGRVEADRHMD